MNPQALKLVVLFWSINCYHCHKSLWLTDIEPRNGEVLPHQKFFVHYHLDADGSGYCDFCHRRLDRVPNADSDVVAVKR